MSFLKIRKNYKKIILIKRNYLFTPKSSNYMAWII